jgi:hypothetical protein
VVRKDGDRQASEWVRHTDVKDEVACQKLRDTVCRFVDGNHRIWQGFNENCRIVTEEDRDDHTGSGTGSGA